MFSELRRFHFSSVILSYLPLSSSKEERELERDGPDTTDLQARGAGRDVFCETLLSTVLPRSICHHRKCTE